jgi:glycosyltransferase involved in cell wall biosynthesis
MDTVFNETETASEWVSYEWAPKSFPVVSERATVRGKFLFVGDEKFWVKGVTYGTFRPDNEGNEYGRPDVVKKDFAAMALAGINTVRLYTIPPRWLLDVAQSYGLRVMVGLPWEQHVAFLDDKKQRESIEERVRTGVRRLSGHAAILCYSVGNEIPSSIVRWHGRRSIEKSIGRLYRIAKQEDPTALVTYVNFPTTEYLQLPFLDFVCFNVYLESKEPLEAYLARLHNLSDDRPLLIAEIGLDSLRNGEQEQAEVLDWQIRTAFESGACGAFIYAWTDEWHRGGQDITDWKFGLTTSDRSPKQALESVRRAFAETPFRPDIQWPKISVVVCSLNGAATIQDTLEGLRKLNYPDFEVIVVNDGSTDETPAIAERYPVTLINTTNRGLSCARNTGMEATSGEIVAYIDDDAYPDPDWLHFLALSYLKSGHAGVGGPNIAPPGDGVIADCVANSPGGPVHVLLTDTLAEHIPGCNMSFRRSALEAVGGFDPRYRAAGDDVDLCWRVMEQVGTIGFNPAAVVWHHRRNSVRMYWKQQQGYGKAEALLEEKWPEKYNTFGHTSWGGRLYGKGVTVNLGALRGRVYQGVWGGAPFQSMYQPRPNSFWSLPLMPEWYLLVALLAVLTLLGVGWKPLLLALPLLIVAVVLPVVQAFMSARRGHFTSCPKTPWQRFKLFAVTMFMHLQQPLARLIGRFKHGLTPWRMRGNHAFDFPVPKVMALWREQWEAPETTLSKLEDVLKQNGAIVRRGGHFDDWDLELRGGLLGSVRLLMGVEEHGAGRQLVRFRIRPKISMAVAMLIAGFGALAIAAAADQSWASAIGSGLVTAMLLWGVFTHVGFAIGSAGRAVQRLEPALETI